MLRNFVPLYLPQHVGHGPYFSAWGGGDSRYDE